MGRLQALGGVEATPQVVKAAGQTVTPQGVVAAFPIPPPPRHFPDEGLLIILDQVRDPTNLGTILRSAEAGGCAGVIALEGSADLFHPKVVRGGMGVHMRLPLRGEAAWTEVDRLIQGRQVYVAEAHGGIAYDTVNWIAPAALIIGNETSGPSAEARQRGQGVTIPLLGPTESLNTAVAASIIIFEAARQRRWHR
jgi:TrmH family RNA methyltransferase